jgi:CheY-like chemotaxis protein
VLVKDIDAEMARGWASAAEMLSINKTTMKTVLLKTVLLADDCEDDILMMRMALERTGVRHRLQIVTDGEMAVDYLSAKGAFVDRMLHPVPDVLFLDIKMPKRSGHEVLEWVRSQPGLKELPVVMLSGSVLPADVNRAYKLGVTSYLRKVADPAEFGHGVWVILKYWLELNLAPVQAETGPNPAAFAASVCEDVWESTD